MIAEAGGTPAMFSHTADALVSVDADAAGYLDLCPDEMGYANLAVVVIVQVDNPLVKADEGETAVAPRGTGLIGGGSILAAAGAAEAVDAVGADEDAAGAPDFGNHFVAEKTEAAGAVGIAAAAAAD